MLKTPLHSLNTRLGAKMVEFAGWEMPLYFAGIIEEHHHTRRAASIFDVSHMGRVQVAGGDAEALLQRVCTRQLADMTIGQSRYSHVCNEAGGIIDDVIVSRYEKHWLVVCNAGNRTPVIDWLTQHAESLDTHITDTTEQTLMIAIQGPEALATLDRLLPISINGLKRYHFQSGNYMFTPYSIFRSGYTGEDGVELILPGKVAGLLGGLIGGNNSDDVGLKPAGLGARDTLRLEAGMPLHGHELHEDIDSISAGASWCVDLEKDFIGGDALRSIAETGPSRKLVGLELDGRRIARQGMVVSDDGRTVGEVTSGTLSPTLGKSIAMAYVDASLSEKGQRLTVQLGSSEAEASVVALPFYKRSTD